MYMYTYIYTHTYVRTYIKTKKKLKWIREENDREIPPLLFKCKIWILKSASDIRKCLNFNLI